MIETEEVGLPVRMRDVAERAGVSVRTVSNVVNDYHYVKPATRRRVQQALDELGFEVNAAARSLRSGRTGMIAFVVPELRSPYFAELADAVVRAARYRGLTVLIEVTEADPAAELKVLTGGRHHLTDGTLFSPVRLEPDAAAVERRAFPLVMLGESDLVTAFDHVGFDNTAAAAAVVQHLVDLRRTRIAAIGANPLLPAGVQRQLAFEQTLAAAGLRPHSISSTATWDREQGAAAVEALLARPGARPDAIFAFNDTAALGALSALWRAGVDVPGEIAVAGLDDIDEAQYASPPLTTVAPDMTSIAEAALDLLSEQMETARRGDLPQPPRLVQTPYQLMIRASTDAQRAGGTIR